ncbi:19076_t:CDS:2 [Funneliformis geosporum]|uniref:6625_t:CDS:1 n=1 Tax=Funneliformis geosporum TaxID=1117311 RepID=A0A9W4WUS8_9GLOM|nr:19076_t:CDS:2 [Funneliformis geosporum]CAI2180546.1 6625_t:CDS:2 [Funneliformis geosporum]
MVDFKQIFDYILTLNKFDFAKILIVTAVCLVVPTLYLYRKRASRLNRSSVIPKQTIIIHERTTTVINYEAEPSTDKNENIDISSYGGFIPYLRKLHADQGVCVSSKLPYPNTISVIDPMIIKATLPVGDRPVYLFKFLEPFLGEDNLQVYNADRAARFRKLVAPSLGNEVIVAKYKSIRDFGIKMIKKWEKLVKDNKDHVFKMQEENLEFSMRATLNVVLSIDTEDLDISTYKRSYDIVLSGLFDKQFGILDFPREEQFQQSLEVLKGWSCNFIDQRRKKAAGTNEEKTGAKDLLDILVSNNEPETEKPYSDESITCIISGYIMAGFHTTGVAIPYTILALTQNPDVQTKLQEEIDKILEGRLPNLDELSKMEYLTQVVKESLRVHPPGAFCARLLKSETLLPTLVESKSFTVPADTTIIYPIPLFHENPDYFPEPEKFDPTRFSYNKIKDFTPNTYCPFGFGARKCPAERISMVEIKMMICLIMQKFNVELAMKLEDVVKEERFVVMAKNDIIVKLVPRERVNME